MLRTRNIIYGLMIWFSILSCSEIFNGNEIPEKVIIIDTLMTSDSVNMYLWTFQTEGYMQGEWSRLRISLLNSKDSLKKSDGFIMSNWITSVQWIDTTKSLIVDFYRPKKDRTEDLYDLYNKPEWINLYIGTNGIGKDMIFYNLPDPYFYESDY